MSNTPGSPDDLLLYPTGVAGLIGAVVVLPIKKVK